MRNIHARNNTRAIRLPRIRAIELPDYCSLDTPMKECVPRCSGLYTDDQLAHTLKLRDAQEARLLCDVFLPVATELKGDHVDSSSPRDPSFWPIHPTLERLYQYRVLTTPFVHTHWGGKMRSGGPVCSAADTEFGDLDLPQNFGCFDISDSDTLIRHTNTVLHDQPDVLDPAYQACCYGHFEKDRAFSDVSLADWEVPTNVQMLKWLDPTTIPSNEYGVVYHHFRWTHCGD